MVCRVESAAALFRVEPTIWRRSGCIACPGSEAERVQPDVNNMNHLLTLRKQNGSSTACFAAQHHDHVPYDDTSYD